MAGATDMRKGFEGLYALARDRIGQDPMSGHLFGFCNRSRTRAKFLYWDGSGLWLCAKRLSRGRYSWPGQGGAGGAVKLGREELALLLGGIDLGGARRKGWHRAEV